ncbi:hypothetical protein KSF_074960 [Reticulibacter mediterranei]|uniref:IS6 family transposase n=1 Tax=Reticulibacter mediterranei TaxID=2778369 RepID=A0A8J3N6D5_9CHLR|nr:hypothetical protein KSF_074960 [Reticulibacter mediterranei]
MSHQHPFKWRHYQAEVIVLCVRWYLRYALSYRESSRNHEGAGAAYQSQHDVPLGPVLCS